MPLTPSETGALITRLGIAPRKRWGQNFLIDGNIVRKSIQLSGLSAGERVVEVGPGLGTLSAALREAGGAVWAVEIDPALAAYLGERFGGDADYHLLYGDALEHPLAALPHPADPPYRIVANLPYAIATPWLDAVLENFLPESMTLMLQKECADRFTAQAGSKSYGPITVFLEAAFRPAGVHKVSAACFYPRPAVDSALLHLERRDDAHTFSKGAKNLIRTFFQQRRKQIGALIRQQVGEHPALEEWRGHLEHLGHSTDARPEDLPLSAWLALDRLSP